MWFCLVEPYAKLAGAGITHFDAFRTSISAKPVRAEVPDRRAVRAAGARPPAQLPPARPPRDRTHALRVSDLLALPGRPRHGPVSRDDAGSEEPHETARPVLRSGRDQAAVL